MIDGFERSNVPEATLIFAIIVLNAARAFARVGATDDGGAFMTGSGLCQDCGVDTTPCTGQRGCRHRGRWEHYMVHNSLWRAAGMDIGALCIGCLEARIGRRLRPSDFTPARINDPGDPWNTPRLADRLRGSARPSQDHSNRKCDPGRQYSIRHVGAELWTKQQAPPEPAGRDSGGAELICREVRHLGHTILSSRSTMQLQRTLHRE
jgi:hypothetical protein